MSGIDANTKLLLHLSGAHGATAFPDHGAGNVVTPVGGAAVTTAIHGPFGSAPGVLYCDGAGDYLSVADTDALNIGTGSFGIDFWFRDDFSSASYPAIVASAVGWGGGAFSVRFNNSGYAGKITVHWDAAGNPVLSGVSASTVRVWHHVLVQRLETVMALFIDGVLQGSVTTPATNTTAALDLCAGGAFLVGCSGDGANGYFKGHVAELRVVKGAAPTMVATDPLYIPSGNLADGFTPPTAPYSPLTRTGSLRGLSGVASVRSVTAQGLHGVRSLFHAGPRGLSGVAAPRLSGLRGLVRVLRTYRHDGRGGHRVLLTFASAVRGLSRVANTGLDRYELFRGVDAPADTAGTPWETFSALPHETGALEPGHAYAFVLRRRNAFGLSSENIDAWSVELDADGAVSARVPSSPESFSAVPTSGLRVRVAATYLSINDGDEPATHWAVYAAVGADPDPEHDTPTLIPVTFVGALSTLRWTSGAYGDGDEVRVLVRMRRAVEGGFAESANMSTVPVSVTSAGPSGTVPGAFFGYAAKQGNE